MTQAHDHNHDHGHSHQQGDHKVTTLDLIKRYLSLKIQKMTTTKRSAFNPDVSPLDRMPNIEINHIAIVLDGKVQDVMRTQNRMAAMLLSEPKFVLFDPKETQIGIGYDYIDGKFIKNEEAN